MTFNLFSNVDSSNDDDDVRYELMTTRLFLLLMTGALAVLIFYTGLSLQQKTVFIDSPSLATYEALDIKYHNTLTCPCSEMSVKYASFLSFTPTYHQVCNSSVVSDQWFDYLVHQYSLASYYSEDLRTLITPHFVVLKAFCQLSQTTVTNAVVQFDQRIFVSAQVLSEDLFQLQGQSFINLFKSQTSGSFTRLLDLISSMTQGNNLIPMFDSHFLVGMFGSQGEILPYNGAYGDDNGSSCRCQTSSICTSKIGIYDSTSGDSFLFTVDGFRTGCWQLEALFQSTLECFFNQTCFDRIQSLINSSVPLNATILNSTLLINYSTTSTIGTMVKQLMLEQWNASISYSHYYNECSPNYCMYTYTTRLDTAFMLTIILSLVGGLSKVLRVVTPLIILLFRQLRNRKSQEDEKRKN
ncbi:unnamed protein product [Didymodactylos carnosus]|uniref:Uncharacterized protein n=1 Tax=Didymodactylos carnosus TaxID=1234261 RepID=A0A814VLM9_9BILA|nr:unnamed protein product [Didymodactylos carnosus]CAF3954210.1 unnamed protein product [Didymodactylos carnosus]